MDTRTAIMLNEERLSVPEDVREELRAAGFVPTLDAGNLWFYDRDNQRLVCGEDGSDLPQSMDEDVEIYETDGEGYADDPVYSGPLGEFLSKARQP